MKSIRYQYNLDDHNNDKNPQNPDRLTTIQQQDAEWMAYMKQLRLRDEAQMKRERKVINFMLANM